MAMSRFKTTNTNTKTTVTRTTASVVEIFQINPEKTTGSTPVVLRPDAEKTTFQKFTHTSKKRRVQTISITYEMEGDIVQTQGKMFRDTTRTRRALAYRQTHAPKTAFFDPNPTPEIPTATAPAALLGEVRLTIMVGEERRCLVTASCKEVAPRDFSLALVSMSGIGGGPDMLHTHPEFRGTIPLDRPIRTIDDAGRYIENYASGLWQRYAPSAI